MFWDLLFFATIFAFAFGFVLFGIANASSTYFSRFKKRVGPTYWGVYKGSPRKEDPSMTMKPAKPSLTERIIAGSSVYVKGKPVKSLRR